MVCIGQTRLIHGHLMLKNDQQQRFTNAACESQRLKIASGSALNGRTAEKSTI